MGIKITDLVDQQAMQQLTDLGNRFDDIKTKYIQIANELVNGINIKVTVIGDLEKLDNLVRVQSHELVQVTQQMQSAVAQQNTIIRNTTNTISRALAEQERLNKTQRESYQQDEQAQRLANALLGTRQQNYELLARYKDEMQSIKESQKQLNEQEKAGLITQEEAIQRRAALMAEYDHTKTAAQELQKILAAENREAVAVQGSYQQLSQRLERLRQAYKQMTDVQKSSLGGQKIENEIQELDAHLKDLDADMGQHQRNVGNYAIAAQSMKSSLRELTEEIAQLTVQYREMSDEEQRSEVGVRLREKIAELTDEAAKYKDVIADVKESISGSASDTRWFDTMIESGQMMVATFGLAKNAALSLGMSEKSVEDAMLGVQRAMQAVQALQVIQNTLQSQSNVMKGIGAIQSKALTAAEAIEAKVKTQGTKATIAQTVAQRVFNAVAKANPYILLATAILTVIGLVVSYTGAIEENAEAEKAAAAAKERAAEAAKEKAEYEKKLADATRIATSETEARRTVEEKMADTVASSVGKQLANLEFLIKKWEECGDNIDEQNKFLQDYRKQLDDTTFAINDVSTATQFLTQKKKFVEDYFYACAKAAAAAAVAAELFKQQLLMELNPTIDNGGHYYNVTRGFNVLGSQKNKGQITQDEMLYLLSKENEDNVITGSYIRMDIKPGSADELGYNVSESGAKIIEQKRNQEANALRKKLKDANDAQIKQILKVQSDAYNDASDALSNLGMAPKSNNRSNSSSNNSSNNREKQRQRDAEKAAQQAAEAAEKLEEAQIQAMDDGIVKTLALIRLNYKKKIDAIKGNSDNEKNLRLQYEEDMNTALANAQAQYDAKRYKIDLDNRLAAVEEGSREEYELKFEKLENEYAMEVAEADKTGADVNLIREKYNKEADKLTEEYLSKRIDKLQEAATTQQLITDNALKEELSDLNLQQVEELAMAGTNAEKIAEIKERYAAKSAEVQELYAIKTANAQLKSLTDQLRALDIAEDEIDDMIENLSDVDGVTAILEAQGMAHDDALNLAKSLASAEVQIDDAVTAHKLANMERVTDAATKAWDARIANAEKWLSAVGEACNNINDLISTLFDAQIAKIEEQQEANQQQHDAAIANIEDEYNKGLITQEESEIRKREIEEATAKREAELQKKKAQAEYKQALAEKANNISQIVIATSLGIMKASPNWVNMALVAAMGAIQLATAIAQPIKAYKRGTDYHPGGLAIVGDGGKREVVETNGKYWLTPKVPTLVEMPEGSKVFPDYLDFIANEPPVNYGNLLAALPLPDISPLLFAQNKPKVIVNNDYRSLQRELVENNRLMKAMIKQQHRDAARFKYDQYRAERI